MQITIDTNQDSNAAMRQAAMFLLHLIGDLDKDAEPDDSELTDAAWLAKVKFISDETLKKAIATPPPPPPPPVIFPPPPAPASPVADAPSAMVPVVPPVPITAVEYDSAGIPWDARIHQRAKAKKKDGTWKVQKGIDQALLQLVVMEMAANKPVRVNVIPNQTVNYAQETAEMAKALMPPPPPPSDIAKPSVPPPPPSDIAKPSVPPPPPQEPAATGAMTFRTLVDKITALTRDKKLTAAQVMQIVQSHGAPNLMALNSMAHLVPDVNASIDAALLL